MRVLNVDDTAVDLNAQNVPFLPNNTVVALNLTAGQLVLQESDSEGSGYTTLATLESNEPQEVTLSKQYIKVSTAATISLLGN